MVWVVEVVVAVGAVKAVLRREGAAVGLGERAHERHGAFVLGDVGGVQEVCRPPGAEREVRLLEGEFLEGLGAVAKWEYAAAFRGVEGHAAQAEVWRWERERRDQHVVAHH